MVLRGSSTRDGIDTQGALLGLVGLILLGMFMRDHIRPDSGDLAIRSGDQWVTIAEFEAKPAAVQPPRVPPD